MFSAGSEDSRRNHAVKVGRRCRDALIGSAFGVPLVKARAATVWCAQETGFICLAEPEKSGRSGSSALPATEGFRLKGALIKPAQVGRVAPRAPSPN